MRILSDAAPVLWGAVGGAALCALIGFTWGGWMTDGSAQMQAAIYAHDTVVTALAPICGERFRTQGDAFTQIATLVRLSAWARGSVVERNGFASMSGSKDPLRRGPCLGRDAGRADAAEDLTMTEVRNAFPYRPVA
jgi:hypothetical protein